MKRLITLLLAAGLVCSLAYVASAADIKAKGVWDIALQYNDSSFAKHETADRFDAKQRFRTQIDVIASENLKGVVFFEIGDTNWGRGSQGGSLGTDGIEVEVRYSYIDWVVPDTDLKIRMGLQPFVMPGFVAGSAVLDGDGAGITASYDFTQNVGANLFWLRAENDNNSYIDKHGFSDTQNNALDFVGLTLPMTFDGAKVTPWGMYGFVGNRSLSGNARGDINDARDGMLPVLPGTLQSLNNAFTTDKSRGNAWWGGITGELTLFNPFRLAGDFNYGSVDMGSTASLGTYPGSTSSKKIDLKRSGWLLSALAEYKLDMMTPGLLLWYGSGDNSNAYDGSERMPVVDGGWKGSSFGFDNGYGIDADTALGTSPVGTWGAALRLKDISFIEELTHTFQVGYYRGTNDKNMPKNAGMRSSHTSYTDTGGLEGSTYLTEKDAAWEVTFDSQYQIYQDLTLALELGYLRLDLNDSVWGNVINATEDNAYKVALNMRYAF
ncbi:MAG: outer membrane homotrimeric porin [Bilophila sp.]